jgi:hypothetical protein
MARQRKLFIAHASELAHLLIRAVRPHGLVADFARSYARRHHRVGVVDEPHRVRELEATLGREAILVMVAEVLRLMPSALGARRNIPLAPEEAGFVRLFLSEFMTALGRGLDWPPDEMEAEQEAFDRDLLMYRRWFERTLTLDVQLPQDGTSPFLDRCALLLDPSTMEEARAAAAGFERDLTAAAAHIFGMLGQPGGDKPRRAARHRPARPAARKSRLTKKANNRKPAKKAKRPSRHKK